MNKRLQLSIATAIALFMTTPSEAQLLGGVLDTVGGVVDTVGGTVESVTGGGVGDVVSTNNGPAGGGALVNLGIGDGGSRTGNLVDLSLGPRGGNSLANVRAGQNGGRLNGEINLLGGDGNTLLAGLDLGGLGLDLGIGIGIDGRGNGGSGGPAGPRGPAGGGGGGGGGAMGVAFGAANCSVDQGRQLLQAAAARDYPRNIHAQWRRASRLSIVPVRLCPSTRRQVAQILAMSGKVTSLQSAVRRDPRLAPLLAPTPYEASNVFAVDQSGDRVTFYVY